MQKKSYKGELLLLITALLWSTGGLFIKMLPSLNGIAINGLRSIIGFVVIFAYTRKLPKLNFSTISAGIALFAVCALFVVANKHTTSANAVVLQYTAPIFVLILISVKNKKFPSLVQILIIAVAFVGMILVFVDKIDSGNLFGNIIAVLAGVAFSLVFFLNGLPNSSPQDASMIGFIIGALVGIPFYFGISDFGMANVLPLLGLGIFQVGLPYLLFGIGIKYCSSTTASIIGLVEACLNPVWVFLLVGEAPGVLGIIGCLLVLLTVLANIMYESKISKLIY